MIANKAQEGEIMPSVTVRNVPDEVHRALRVRAAKHGRSAEAEIREILENAVLAEGRVKLGSLLAGIGRKINLSDDEFSIFAQSRDKPPAKLHGKSQVCRRNNCCSRWIHCVYCGYSPIERRDTRCQSIPSRRCQRYQPLG